MEKRLLFIIVLALTFLGGYSLAHGFNSGSTGALGAFNPTTNTEVELPADGILNYTTVNIPAGVTVTFKKNALNTPVYLLATGDVTIAGTIRVNGIDGNGMFPGNGGPGGFDGGLGGTINVPGGKGFGPGGGNPGSVSTSTTYPWGGGGGGGGFGTSGSNGWNNIIYAAGGSGGGTYGNVRLIPLIGGSGGGGGAASLNPQYIGGAGGGGGGGSGGAIKLMSNTIAGEGNISASGGAHGTGAYSGGAGGAGMIRFEANTITRVANTTPQYTYSYPGTVFVTNIPTLKITSVGGVNVPATPSGKFGSPDITLPSTTTNPVTVNITATNTPVGTTVTVTSVPEYGASSSATGTLSGTDASSSTSVSITLSTTYQNILTASATFTIQQAMYYDDEKIEKVRVATKMGSGSEVVYITEKGKEIKLDKLMARLMR